MTRLFVSFIGLLIALTCPAQNHQYDINKDGRVNIRDAVLLVNRILTAPNDEETLGDDLLSRRLTVKVAENPLSVPNEAKAGMRRAPAIFTNTLDHFYINMMYFDGDFWWNTDRSETYRITTTGYYENNEHWPIYAGNDDDVTVFGYYSYYKSDVDFFELNDGNPYLMVATEESSNDQRDVLVAKKVDTWNNCQGEVYLVFNHVCAALQFSLIKTAKLADYTVQVNEVKLHNIHKSGKYALLTGEWFDVVGNSNFTLNAYKEGIENAITIGNDQETLIAKNESDYLFLIPQTITGMAKGTSIANADKDKAAYLEIKCKIFNQSNEYKVGSANEYGSVYLPFSATLTAGHIHPFTISMGTALRDANGNKIFN